MKKIKQMSIEKDIKNQISTSYLLFFKNLFQKFSKLKVFLIVITLLFLNIGAKYPVSGETLSSETTVTNSIEVKMYPYIVRSRLHQDLVNEVETYIYNVAPTSKLDAEKLVTLCQKHNMDISFVLAQGMIESTLGTKGKAVTTKSLFNVGTYDDGQIRYTYKTVNHAIEPFLILIKDKYLGDKKNITDLIKDGGYKTLKGYRYASYLGYEARLRTMIIHVNMHSQISMYQDVINLSDEKILAYFGPVPDSVMLDSTKLLTYNMK